MSLRLTIEEMANEAGHLFKIVLPGGQFLLGRVVRKGYFGGGLSTGSFRLYESFQQFDEGTDEHLRTEETIHEGQFVVVQRVDRHNFDHPSTYERILQLDGEIQAFKESYRDYGIIMRNLPDRLEELNAALATFHEEQKTFNSELVQDLLDSHIRECRNCPPSVGKTVEEDQQYKVMTISQAKYYAREAVLIALSRYVPTDVTRLPALWPKGAGR